MASDLKNILLTYQERIGTITLNCPDRLNTLSLATLQELRRAVEDILRREKVRVAVVTGAGEKAFAAGADISELAKLDATEAKKFAELGQGVFNLIENGDKPFIAAES